MVRTLETDYLHFEITGGDNWVHVSHTGGFGADSHAVGASYSASAETQQIILATSSIHAARILGSFDPELPASTFTLQSLRK